MNTNFMKTAIRLCAVVVSPGWASRFARASTLLAGVLLFLEVLSGKGMAQTPIVHDAFTDFSFNSNPTPDGIWSYGYTLNLGGPVNLYTTKDTEFSLSIWERPGFRDPNVIKNETGAEITVFGEIFFPTSDFLHFHPGPGGEYSVIRWTAPTSGRYRLDATFRSLRVAGADTTTTVQILEFGRSIIFTGVIDSNDDILDFSTEIRAIVGQEIDFVVGIGSDGNYLSDSTGLRASLTLLETTPGPPPRRTPPPRPTPRPTGPPGP